MSPGIHDITTWYSASSGSIEPNKKSSLAGQYFMSGDSSVPDPSYSAESIKN